MLDSMISATRVVAVALWVAVGILIVTAWAFTLAGLTPWGQILGFTACATSAAAATAHIRCYALKLCSHIRVNRMAIAGEPKRGPGDDGDEVHRLY